MALKLRALLLLVFYSVVFSSAALNAAPDVLVSGLFKGKALLIIDGTTRILKVGESSPEGITLLASNMKSATVEINGRRFELTMSTHISSAFIVPEHAVVRIPKGDSGHYFTFGVINGHNIEFMVDTGASVVAISAKDAERLGIPYRQGQLTRVSTAAGIVDAYSVRLASLTIGAIKLYGVAASILPGDFPSIPLLGNSFLNSLDISQSQGVLVLKSKL